QVVFALAGSYESTHRALHRLVAAGIVERANRGRELIFTLPRDLPQLRSLRALALHASTVGPRLRWAQETLGVGAVGAGFVFGPLAAMTDGPESDCDLFIVGDASLADVHPFLVGLGDELARELNPVCRSREHVAQHFAEGRSFYRNVWTGARMTVLGTDTAITR